MPSQPAILIKAHSFSNISELNSHTFEPFLHDLSDLKTMTPFRHCQISQFPIEAGDQHQSHIPSLSPGTSSTSTPPCPPFLFDSKEDHGRAFAGALPHLQALLHEEPVPGGDHQREPVKWMPSKMRIMRKMIESCQAPTLKPKRSRDQQHLDQKKENLESIIRVCSDCSTTKTPLWRTGPCGPKSLCNACGIRQRKARRAMTSSSFSFSSVNKDGVSDAADRRVPFKKRCRFTATAASVETAQRKLCYEDVVISLNKSAALHRVFPQDEKDAAILLMALSCGLI